MLRSLALSACLLGAAVAPAAAAPRRPHAMAVSPERAALDRDLPGLMAKAKVPSVSVAQLKGGRVVMAAAWGAQSPGVPATPDTLYNIASLTKPLTAEVILRLVSSGKLDLDESMARWWTDPDIAGDERTKALTARLALSHRSGFPNWRGKDGLKFLRAPGAEWGYSGEGFDYVARYAEKKTGKRFEDLAQASLFVPAGMRSTSYVGKPWFAGRIAVPTDGAGLPLKPTIRTHFSAADLVYTTASDYAAFLGQVFRDRGLSPAVARERSRLQVSLKGRECSGEAARLCPTDVGFGLGWELYDFDGQVVMMHTGKDEGVFTFACLDRATGDGVVVLTNGDNGGSVVLPILERLGFRPAFVRFLGAGH